jgi:hypothetical protein
VVALDVPMHDKIDHWNIRCYRILRDVEAMALSAHGAIYTPTTRPFGVVGCY